MVSYLDTSFLYKLYVNERESASAVAWFRNYQGDVAISDLSDVEIISSLFRNFPRIQASQTKEVYSGDRMLGVYKKLALTDAVYREAQLIAEEHGGTFKLRSLDILHLASALHYRIDAIATFDQRLAEASAAVGLTVLPTRS